MEEINRLIKNKIPTVVTTFLIAAAMVKSLSSSLVQLFNMFGPQKVNEVTFRGYPQVQIRVHLLAQLYRDRAKAALTVAETLHPKQSQWLKSRKNLHML